MNTEKNAQQRIDYSLLFILFLLAIASTVAIISAQPTLPEKLKNINFVAQQWQWYVVGSVAIAVTMIVDYDRFKQVAWYLYGFGFLLLVGLEINFPSSLVQTIKGATSWYKLPGIGNFQPSELMKIFLILVLSQIIVNHREKYVESSVKLDLFLLGKLSITTIAPLLLLVKQPDMGMSMVFMSIFASMLVVSGIRWRILVSITAAFLSLVALLVYTFFAFPVFFKEHLLDDYQLNRFYGWLAPYEHSNAQGFQLIKSLLAIGSGELSGKGYLQTEVFLPESHTDFIFAIIAEQFGFIGASIVIALFFLLIYRMIHIALECNDPYGSYLSAGVIGMITFQVFQNIGMTIGLLPITGLPLPFISYGGSSLATYMLAIGIILNVRSRTKKYLFD
ncbi:FtsW/RodA/SpoVE family cell cycle protein [Bacillus suaedaesalsae]|uniref:Rod shape-determining protein RodA n=1 Tax=Bacillus suaedaesalsae TaxID=2810349 RepID=A0ABS2DIM0_9BACI|nr:FtsW/RodA/SpoVE family cell cycle protein [Bacillus suaedaesalsae]MBM6618252.1 rod shape-determining protein RodA [Bacillus suaedaesalsae]